MTDVFHLKVNQSYSKGYMSHDVSGELHSVACHMSKTTCEGIVACRMSDVKCHMSDYNAGTGRVSF